MKTMIVAACLVLVGSVVSAQDMMEDYYAQMYLYGDYVAPVAPLPGEPLPLMEECNADTALAAAKAQAEAQKMMATGMYAPAAASYDATLVVVSPNLFARLEAIIADPLVSLDDTHRAQAIYADASYDLFDAIRAESYAREQFLAGQKLWDGGNIAFMTGTVESYGRANRNYLAAMPLLGDANDYFAQGAAFRRELQRKYELMIPGAWR